MEFDPGLRNRDIVEDIFDALLPGDPLEEIERMINIDDDVQEDFLGEEESDDEDDEEEQGPKRRRARHDTSLDFTPLQRRRAAGNKQVGETGFVTEILDDPEGASELELENFRKHFRMPVELLKEVVDELKRGGFEDKSVREGKRGPPGHRLDVYVAASLRKLATGNSFKDEELWSGI